MTPAARRDGILFILLSDLLFAFVPITVKWAHGLHYSAVQVTFFRFTFGLMGALLLALLGVQRVRIVNFGPVFWRGFFGGLAVFFYFISLQFTTAGRATLWNYTYSIWANVISIGFLGQRAPRHFAWMLGLGAAGVWLVLGVRFEDVGWGDLAGSLSGATAGASVVAIKEARRTDNALSIFLSFSLFGSLLAGSFLALVALPGAPAGLASLGLWTPIQGLGGWGLLGSMGLLGMGAQLFLTQSLGALSLPLGTLLALLVPVGAALFGLLLLGEPLTPHFLAGTLLVLAACAWLAGREKEA